MYNKLDELLMRVKAGVEEDKDVIEEAVIDAWVEDIAMRNPDFFEHAYGKILIDRGENCVIEAAYFYYSKWKEYIEEDKATAHWNTAGDCVKDFETTLLEIDEENDCLRLWICYTYGDDICYVFEKN